MRRTVWQPLILLAGASVLTACGDKSTTAPTPPAPTVTAINLTGSNSLEPGATVAMTASAVQSDGSTRDVTSTATWQSSNSAVATVASTGRVTGIAPGTSVISAAFGGRTGQLTVQVNTPDNVQIVTISVNRVVINGTCDENSIFETSGDGEFTFSFELERSGTGRTPIWAFDSPRPYTKGGHPVSAATTFNRNVTRGEDFILWFRATEYDGLLGADPRLNGVGAGRSHTYFNGQWVATSTSISLGTASCGARIEWTLSSRPQ